MTSLLATVLTLLGSVVTVDSIGVWAGDEYLGSDIDEALVRAAELAPAGLWGQS